MLLPEGKDTVSSGKDVLAQKLCQEDQGAQDGQHCSLP